MPVDFSADDPTLNESPMFAPVPTWERNKKRRSSMFGARRVTPAVEPRTFAEPDVDTAPIITRAPRSSVGTPATGERLDIVEPTDTAFVAGPPLAGGRRVDSRNGGAIAPLAIAAGLVLVIGAAAGGYYYYGQPHEQGVAQLTPGGAPAADTTVAAPTEQVAEAPAATPATPATPVRTVEAAPVRTARAMPAPRAAGVPSASPSAADEGVNTSAVVPAPTPAPVQVAPVTPAPTQSAPTPAPTPDAPPPSDTPAPTQTAPAPQPSPATPPAEVPPQ